MKKYFEEFLGYFFFRLSSEMGLKPLFLTKSFPEHVIRNAKKFIIFLHKGNVFH